MDNAETLSDTKNKDGIIFPIKKCKTKTHLGKHILISILKETKGVGRSHCVRP